MRRPLVMYDFPTAPFLISLYIIWGKFYFIFYQCIFLSADCTKWPYQLFPPASLEYRVAEEEDLWVKWVGALGQHHLLHPHCDWNTNLVSFPLKEYSLQCANTTWLFLATQFYTWTSLWYTGFISISANNSHSTNSVINILLTKCSHTTSQTKHWSANAVKTSLFRSFHSKLL